MHGVVVEEGRGWGFRLKLEVQGEGVGKFWDLYGLGRGRRVKES